MWKGSNGRRSIPRLRALVYAAAAAVLTLWIGACTAPDSVHRTNLELGQHVLETLRPDTVRKGELHPGVAYFYLWVPSGPWAVHLVRTEVTRCEVGFAVLRPEARARGGTGRATVSQMVSGRDAADVLAAVNADFFTPEGATVGAEVVDGRVTASAERPTFAWRPGAPPWIGTARRRTTGLDLGWLVEEGGGTRTEAVGGFPDMIDGGRWVGDLEMAARPAFAAARHPRTAVGYDSSLGHLWLAVVDGRQLPHSAGMTLPELADLLALLGADEALNLDGGGSSAMVVGADVVNRPSDLTGERAVANALALVRDPSLCSLGS